MTTMRHVLWLCLALALPLQESAAIDNDPALQRLLLKATDRGYPGIAVITSDRDGEVRAAAVGYSSLENNTALRIDDAFHVASINKTFTAVATLRLVDQGRLSLDTTIGATLGEAVAKIPNAQRITIAQLLDHSSGVYATNNDPGYLATLIGSKADPCYVWPYPDLVALASSDRQQAMGEPGSGHYYSDTNYVLLGMVIEKISGRALKTVISEELFAPLGMQHTYFYSDYLCTSRAPPAKTVQGYLLATPDIRQAVDINPMFRAVAGAARKEGELLNTTLAAERVDAAGGIVSTLPDLLKFAGALYRGKLLSARSQNILTAAVVGADKMEIDKHRTWTLQAMRKPYGVVLYKEGDGPGGVNTLMAYLPGQDQIFIGFTNIFGNFDEVDFLLDEVIGPLTSAPVGAAPGTAPVK